MKCQKCKKEKFPLDLDGVCWDCYEPDDSLIMPANTDCPNCQAAPHGVCETHLRALFRPDKNGMCRYNFIRVDEGDRRHEYIFPAGLKEDMLDFYRETIKRLVEAKLSCRIILFDGE